MKNTRTCHNQEKKEISEILKTSVIDVMVTSTPSGLIIHKYHREFYYSVVLSKWNDRSNLSLNGKSLVGLIDELQMISPKYCKSCNEKIEKIDKRLKDIDMCKTCNDIFHGQKTKSLESTLNDMKKFRHDILSAKIKKLTSNANIVDITDIKGLNDIRFTHDAFNHTLTLDDINEMVSQIHTIKHKKLYDIKKKEQEIKDYFLEGDMENIIEGELE